METREHSSENAANLWKLPGPPQTQKRRIAPPDFYTLSGPDIPLPDSTESVERQSIGEVDESKGYENVTQNDMSTSAELEVSLEFHAASQSGVSPVLDEGNVQMPAVSVMNNNQPNAGDFPVYYSNRNGEVGTRHDTVRPQPDGRQVIETSHYQAQPDRYANGRPLTQRYQLTLKIVSIVAAVLFFPAGIPAAYFAFKTAKEFNRGILRGDIDMARKCARRAEKFIIFSFLFFVMIVVLSIALYERSKWSEDQWTGHRILPG